MPGIPRFVGGSEDTKGGVVSNVYDPDAVTAYTYGMSFDFARAANPATLYAWGDDDQGIGNAAGAHHGTFNRWHGVTPGERSITELKVWGRYLRGDHVTAHYIEVWREDDTEYTLVASSGAITPTAGSTIVEYTTITPASPIAVTIEAGKIYFVGLRVIRTAAEALAPGMYATTGLTFAYNHMRFAVDAATWNGATVSKTDSANHLYTYTAAVGLLQKVSYTSDQLLEQDITTVEAKSYFVPKAVSAPYITKLETAVAADGQALTAITQDINGSGATVNRYTTKLDCGATTPGTNVMTYAAANVTLPDITTVVPVAGAQGQEGCTFDFWWGYRPASAFREDLYWQNRTLESAIHAHKVAVAGNRTTDLTASSTKPGIVTLSGTFTCGKMRTGTKPLALCGDSQTINGYDGYLRSPNTDVYGGLPTALTKERIWLLHGNAGITVGAVGTQIGIFQSIFKSDTPGAGDSWEMAHTYTLGCVWVFCGVGTNDVTAVELASDADARQLATQLVCDIGAIVEELVDQAQEVVLVGLPPCSKAGTHDQYDGKAQRWANRGLFGLALANKCAWYNPWPDIVTPGTENDDLPTMNATYTSDGGTHYNPAGGAVVLAGTVAAEELSTIDLRDMCD